MFLCNLIFLLHVLLVLFVIIAPFTRDFRVQLIHAVVVPSILIHWAFNDNTCCLTVLEGCLRGGVPRDKLFFERLVGSVYAADYDPMIIAGMIMLWVVSVIDLYASRQIWTHQIRAALRQKKQERTHDD